MIRRIAVLGALSLSLLSPAYAQVILGNGLGKECFEAIAFASVPSERHERVCSKALEEGDLIERDRAATLVNRGIARMRLGKFDLALDDLVAARTLRPELGEAYINEGAALLLSGRYRPAIDQLQTALELDADDKHIAYFNLGLAREALGDIEGAYLDFSRALEIQPDWQRARNELVRFNIQSDIQID